ncbi:PmbA/TldA family metallopeptidase, partial [Nocardia wallacei]|uniref:PmbA/TldA family metallopeptidase n=1 Tax=Nocardia wallacei TaxID=480035 RepID=UPI003CC7FE43
GPAGPPGAGPAPRAAGATHADLRGNRLVTQSIRLRDGRVEAVGNSTDLGFAVRGVVGGPTTPAPPPPPPGAAAAVAPTPHHLRTSRCYPPTGATPVTWRFPHVHQLLCADSPR